MQAHQQQQMMADNDAAALATEIFDHFCAAITMRQILGLYRNMCDTIGLRPGPLNEFYPKLKSKVRSWKAQALWKKFDTRASHRTYSKGNAATGTRVLVIGAGPCGLRTAIEAQLLGAKVVVVEKRDRISRNNVLHLWPFVITDLRNLGAKKFYGKFCAGSIDHISIRQLQCILLKVALLLGVEVHEGVSFENTIEPSDGCGWRAQVSPEDHAVSHYEFDVLIGADGKRNTLERFRRKEFRGKLAIAITANFINKKTEAEAKVEEISGVAFIFNQSFFKELYQTTGIDLENIVYYKDETHYFVMTAKKHSLIDKGVIMQDFADPAELLAPANVNTDKLLDYAKEAAEFSTKYQMPNLEFAVNHYGKPDVAMFDFTSMFAAEASCQVIVRKNYRLLQCLVGDSLLEPFWPTGSGCARGFLSSMDAAYAIKLWSNPRNSILGVIAQRESIYRLLAQTTPENLQRDIGAYTVDPATRYPNLNKSTVNVWQVKHLLDSDDATLLEQTFMDTNLVQTLAPETPVRRKRRTGDTLPLSTVLLRWIKAQLQSNEFAQDLNELSECFTGGKVLCTLINRYRPDLVDLNTIKDYSVKERNELAFKILETELGIPQVMSAKDSLNLENVDSKIWLNYLEQICEVFRGEIPHVKHPKLDFFELKERTAKNNAPDFSHLFKANAKKSRSPMQDIDMAQTVHRRSILDEEKIRKQRKYGPDFNPVQTDTTRRAKKRRSQEKTGNIDRERGIHSAMPRGGAADEQFSDRIKSMEQKITSRTGGGIDKKPKDLLRAIGKIESTDWNVREIEKKIEQSKRTEIGKSKEKVPKWSKEQFLARQNKMAKPERQESVEEKFKDIDKTLKNFDKQLKEGSVLEVGERGKNKVASIAGQFVKKDENSDEKSVPVQRSTSKAGLVFNKKGASEKCHFCKQTVYLMEKISTEGLILHRSCLKCYHCHTNLRLGAYAFDRDDPIGRFYCTQHFRLPAKAVRPVVRKSTKNQNKSPGEPAKVDKPSEEDFKTPERLRGRPENLAQLDLLDRGQTPERIEFENADALSDGGPSQEHIIDENEWTDRNFITESEDTESNISDSDSSDDDSESDYEEANGSPLGVQTLQLATDWIGKQRHSYMDDDSDGDFYDSSEGLLDDDDLDSQTEGEEFKKAREMRRQEVKVLPPPQYLPTDTETEVQSDSESSSPDDIGLNSATEISTDSEFDHDPIYREAPPRIFIDDTHIRKPTRVQVRHGIIANSPSQKQSQTGIQQQPTFKAPEIEFKPLVQVDPSLLSSNRIPLKNPRAGDYLLSKAPSTEGIASRKSLELKKRYLLGEQGIGNGIMKSGSTSILDSKLKSFHSNISECQKLLNPSPDISPSMKTFLEKTKVGGQGAITANISDLEKKSSDEKENVFVNSQNALNKGKEFSESMNSTIVENKEKRSGGGKVCSPIIETIDLISPEKSVPIIDLTESPSPNAKADCKPRESFVDLTVDASPEKEKGAEESPVMSEKPDVSKDVKEKIPDIITHVEEAKAEKAAETNNDIKDTCIEVPTIPWNNKKQPQSDVESDSLSNSSTSSLEDIPHFILDSTTSPETQNGVEQIVPRVEVHDSTGNLMQIDSLMIIDGKYVGDPEDLKHMEIPKGISLPGEKADVENIKESKSVEKPKNQVEASTISKPITSEVAKPPTLIGSVNKPELKFDTKNENKVDTLKNIPLVLEKNETQRPIKPTSLVLAKSKSESYVDKDKTPTASELTISDSETEVTGQVLTETELSDWTADDAVSENFVDIEFALNSNRGTIKRNKKHKKKLSPPKAPLSEEITENKSTTSEPRTGAKNSESSKQKSDCSILKNLNIEEIEFMDTGSEGSCAETYSATNRAMLQNRGYIEFIENVQGNIHIPTSSDQSFTKSSAYLSTSETPKEIEGVDYIEQGACILNNDVDLKTPVNEVPPVFAVKSNDQIVPAPQPDSVNDIDDDSLMYITSQGTGTGTTTTEESDVLTVVVSPLDISRRIGEEPSQTASSSDKNEKTTSNSSAASKIPVRKSSDEHRHQSTDDLASVGSVSKKRDSEDISYEEYVRKLQMKITQISNARDSLDIRKQRRKSSKGSGAEIIESTTPTPQNNSVIENNKNLSLFAPSVSLDKTPKGPEQQTTEVSKQLVQNDDKTETPAVTKKLEEITKERTKQKDLIHDLVMDKLQSKKQLNLEKRLNRSRNRTLMLGATPSPPLKVATDYQCSNSPHYHVSSSERRNSKSSPSIINEKDTKLVLSASPSKHIPQDELARYKERPLSDNLEQTSYAPKITKTQSFCVYSTRYLPLKDDAPKSADQFKSANTFVTPHPPPRAFKKLDDTSLSTTTEKLRAEARARARLKSNEDLGLSPEEKLKLLRKRYHLDLQQALEGTSTNQSDDMKVRERKMVTSKSFNDITAVQGLINSDENFTTKSPMQLSDCTSDPNLGNSSEKVTKIPTATSRRRKDPERRKSLIQAVSNFFHKKKDKDGLSSTPTSPKDKSEGVFSRFKISPKGMKEKSKDRDESTCERSKSQDFLKNERPTTHSSSPQLYKESTDDSEPPPIPPLPLNYQRSDDESYTTECREQKKQRAISKASRQAELKRLRIAQEIQREQEEIEVKLKELEARGVLIEKALRGEGQDMENLETSSMGASDEKLLKELLEIWRNITQLKKRDEELGIRQKELQLEHRHAQLKEELNNRLSCSKLDKSSADIAAEGAILNEMLEIVAKRAALRPSESTAILRQSNNDNHSDI